MTWTRGPGDAASSTATPTAGWGNSASIGGGNTWQNAAYVAAGEVIMVGGFSSTALWRASTTVFPTLRKPYASGIAPTNTQANPQAFNLGNQVVFTNCNGQNEVESSPVGLPTAVQILGAVLPSTIPGFSKGSWIGGDGRIYVINPVAATRRIWRSARKKVYVADGDDRPYRGALRSVCRPSRRICGRRTCGCLHARPHGRATLVDERHDRLLRCLRLLSTWSRMTAHGAAPVSTEEKRTRLRATGVGDRSTADM